MSHAVYKENAMHYIWVHEQSELASYRKTGRHSLGQSVHKSIVVRYYGIYSYHGCTVEKKEERRTFQCMSYQPLLEAW